MRIFDRRIGRLGFAIGYLLLPALLLVTYSLVDGAQSRLAAFLFYILAIILLTVWRCHDFNETPATHAIKIDAAVTSVRFLVSFFSQQGDKGFNSHGSPPLI